MNKKTVVILVCIPIISTAFLPIVGSAVNADTISGHSTLIFEPLNNDLHMPGCMKGNSLDRDIEFTPQVFGEHHQISSSFSNDIIWLIEQVDEELFLGHLEGLVAFGPRVTATTACDDAGRYIYNTFKNMDLEVRYHNWSDNGLYGSNIEATIDGINETSEEIYIICAHYDSVPGSPGADDDGSGVAAVLSAAQIMSQYTFNHTIRFIAFSGEEQGLYGSWAYAEEAYGNADNIVAVLNADMIGFAESEEDTNYIRVFEDEASHWITEFTTDISEQYNAIITLDVVPSGYSSGSDHFPFWQAGYHAIFYHEYNFNDYYHSPEDIIEHMNIPYATRVSKLIIATLAELSQLNLVNSPPSKPIIEGPTSGTVRTEYDYQFTAIDPDDDEIYYFVNWGCCGEDEFHEYGPYISGMEVTLSHTWDRRGEYVIQAYTKDVYGAESDITTLAISIPKHKPAINSIILQFREKLLERFPLLSRLQNQGI